MKKLMFLVLMGMSVSCSILRSSSEHEVENSLVTTRKFAEYYIENDSLVIYKLTEYQSDKKIFTENWF